MKKFLFLLLTIPFLCSSQIGINTTTPNAMLDVSSTNNGVLVPRIALTSTIDNVTVVNPQGGVLTTSTLIYNTAAAGVSPDNVIPGFYYWDATPSKWIPINGDKDWSLNGNTAITSPAIPATYGTSTILATENFIGTTDNNDFTLGTNNLERLRIEKTTGDIGIGTADPTEKLHVVENSNSDKSGILSEVAQTSTSFDYLNTGIRGFGNGTVGWGYGVGVMGVSDPANSYFSSGLFGYLGNVAFPPQPSSNQALFANGNNLGNAGIFMNGNVGVGTITPTLARFQVDGMAGNTVALFRGNSTTSQGISMVSDWPGIYFNSYYNGTIRSMSGSGFASIINTDQGTGGLLFQTTNVINPASGSTIASVPVRMWITGNGNVGIGGNVPSNLLHVNSTTPGAVRIVDGTQATGRVLTSNATGVATWQNIGIDNVVGVLSANGVDMPYNQANFLQTGSYITLPPGKFAVNVNMLLARNSSALPSPNNSFFWVRSSFSDSAAANPLPSADIIGSNLASGNFPGTSVYSMLIGTIIINNTTAGNKTYYYVAGRTVFSNTTETLTGIGSTYWAENNIIAYRLN